MYQSGGHTLKNRSKMATEQARDSSAVVDAISSDGSKKGTAIGETTKEVVPPHLILKEIQRVISLAPLGDNTPGDGPSRV